MSDQTERHEPECNDACRGGSHWLKGDRPDFLTINDVHYRPDSVGYEMGMALRDALARVRELEAENAALRGES
jgi:hypothetical protein